MRVKKILPTSDQLSPRERAAMKYIETYGPVHRRFPTIREIATAIGLSASATHTLISRLVGYGYLARWKSSHRCVRGFNVVRSIGQ